MLPRKDSLRLAGSQAAKLLLGTIPLLVVAGVIEAFISPVKISTALKFTLSAVLFTALVLYLMSGRKKVAVQES
jgi:Stage II sporulation protein M